MKGESDMAILTASHLKKYYGKDESLVKALDDVNVSIEDGQFAAVIGTSGSGKSTLLNMLGGLDVPTSGSVQIEGNKLEEMSEEQLTVFRRKRIGFIFQNYNLIPYLTAYENIVLPVRLDGKKEDKKFFKGDRTFSGTGRQAFQLSQPPLRRTAAESCNREGAYHKTGAPALRRAYRKSGQPDQR